MDLSKGGASVVDDSAGSISFSLPEDKLAIMPDVFRWIEGTIESKDGLLDDWAVSHTTLEEVFIRLARHEVRCPPPTDLPTHN